MNNTIFAIKKSLYLIIFVQVRTGIRQVICVYIYLDDCQIE